MSSINDNKNPSIIVDFNVPGQAGAEIEYINQAFKNKHISGDGYFTKKSNFPGTIDIISIFICTWPGPL